MGGGFLVTIVAMAHLPGNKKVADKIIIMAYDKFFNPTMLGILAAAALAAMMSFLSGQLHAHGSMTVQDFFKKISKMKMEPRKEVLLTKAIIAIAALIGLILSFVNPQVLVILGSFSAAMGAQVTITAVCALGNWRWWVTKQGAIAGLVGGTLAMFLTGIKGLTPWYNPLQVYAGLWDLIVNIVLILVVSCLYPGRQADLLRTR